MSKVVEVHNKNKSSKFYEIETTIPQNSTPNTVIDTGVDLTQVSELVFTFTAGNAQQIVSGIIKLKHFPYDINAGGLVHWWDNVGLRVRINSSELSQGVIRLSCLNSVAILKQIEFKE